MIELTIFLVVGCVVLIAGLLALFRGPAEVAREESADILTGLVPLSALDFANFPRFFSDGDYQMLLANPRLRHLARQLRRDRRRIALEWLASLEGDVVRLRRLRRLLARYDVSGGVGEELATMLQAWLIMALISSLRLCVFFFGPFAFARAASAGRQRVQVFWHSCWTVFQRLPKNRWAQFTEEWLTMETGAA